MKLLSVNVSRPKLTEWNGNQVATGIFKTPVEGRVKVRRLNLDGDEQADLTVHGGIHKAVYAYPSEHYAFWREEYPDMELLWGMFGENLTVEGVDESRIHIGDTFRFGTAELQVTQPRLPCFKLGIKFGRMDVVKRFAESGRPGIYFSVVREGLLGVGDKVELIEREKHGVSVMDIVRLHYRERNDFETMRRAVLVEALPESWRENFRDRLEAAGY